MSLREYSEGVVVARTGEGVLPPFPYASEGDTPWPDPGPATPGGPDVFAAGGRLHRSHRSAWGGIYLGLVVAYVVWRLVRLARQRA